MEHEQDGHIILTVHKNDTLEPLRDEAARRGWRILRDETAGNTAHHIEIDSGKRKPLHIFVHATSVIQVQGAHGTNVRAELIAWAEIRGIRVTP